MHPLFLRYVRSYFGIAEPGAQDPPARGWDRRVSRA